MKKITGFLFLCISLFVLYSCISASQKVFTVKWLNADGSLLQKTKVEQNQTPQYSFLDPVKPGGENNEWIFIGWTPHLNHVVANTSYTAVYLDALTYDVSANPFTYVETVGGIAITGLSSSFLSTPNLNLTIPTLINKQKVISISKNAFLNCQNLSHIILPPTLKSIEAGSFAQIESLDYLVLPNALATLEFGWDYALTTVIYLEKDEYTIIPPKDFNNLPFTASDWLWLNSLPAEHPSAPGARYLLNDEWYYNDQSQPVPNQESDIFTIEFNRISINEKYRYLTGVLKIPSEVNGIKILDVDDFLNTKFTEIIIEEGIMYIDYLHGFRNNKLLNKVTLPTTLDSLLVDAFAGCMNLFYLEIPSSLTILRIHRNIYGIKYLIIPSTTIELDINFSSIILLTDTNEINPDWKTSFFNEKIYLLDEWELDENHQLVIKNQIGLPE
jgi:hypothetical protein